MDKIKNNNLDKEKFMEDLSTPFSSINSEDNYSIKEMYKPLFDKKLKHIKVDLRKIRIPQGIVRIYWYQQGENDEQPWLFIAKIKYGEKFKYIYYVAWCDYTGFECEGGMYFYLTDSLSKLLLQAVPEKILNSI
jgi:hypothetical protein